jgi:hypothetical protein
MARKTSPIHKPNKDLTEDTTNTGLCKGEKQFGAVCDLLKMRGKKKSSL